MGLGIVGKILNSAFVFFLSSLIPNSGIKAVVMPNTNCIWAVIHGKLIG